MTSEWEEAHMLFTAEPPDSMEKSSDDHRGLPARSRVAPGRERQSGASATPRGHRPRSSKAGRVPGGSAAARTERLRKEKVETGQVKEKVETGQVKEKVRTTVVDIDGVRDEEVKEVNGEDEGLLEAAEQEEGESEGHFICCCFMNNNPFNSYRAI